MYTRKIYYESHFKSLSSCQPSGVNYCIAVNGNNAFWVHGNFFFFSFLLWPLKCSLLSCQSGLQLGAWQWSSHTLMHWKEWMISSTGGRDPAGSDHWGKMQPFFPSKMVAF